MATHKLRAPRLQGLHARILIDGIEIIRILDGRLLLQAAFAFVEEVFHRGRPSRRVGHLQPLADLVLLPDVVVVIEQVRRPVQPSRNLDLLFRNAETEPQGIERILDVAQEFPVTNLHDVEELLDSGGIVHQFVELSKFPL